MFIDAYKMDRRKVNLAFIRLEHFLEQCTKLDGPNPPSIPTPEMAKNIRGELVYLLDNVEEITCDNVPSVLEVLSSARMRDLPGILRHCRRAMNEFLQARSYFIKRADVNSLTDSLDGRGHVFPQRRFSNYIPTNRQLRDPEDSMYRKSFDTKRNSLDDSIKEFKAIDNFDELKFTNLNNVNRPTKVSEKLNNLYNNEWTDAYEDLQRLYKPEIHGQERSILELATILKRAYEFTHDIALKQISTMSKALEKMMVQPLDDPFLNGSTEYKRDEIDPLMSIRFPKYSKQCLLENAELSLPALIKNFEWKIRREKLRDILQVKSVKSYCNQCVRVTWLMNVQDPPMSFLWASDVKRSELTSMFRYYTRPGVVFRHDVWPALMLTNDGPLFVKGVAQFK